MSYSLDREQWMCIHGVSDVPCETCDVPELREIERRNDVQEATERAAKICDEMAEEREGRGWTSDQAKVLRKAAARIRGEA